MAKIYYMSKTKLSPRQSSRLRRFCNNYRGEIVVLGFCAAILLVVAFVVAPKLEREATTRIERAQQFIAQRPTAAEAEYRLPADRINWFLAVSGDYFLCNHVTLIPLEDHTTIINQYGNYIDPSGESVSISSTARKTPNRCWEKDQNSFTETSYYEFSDCTCLVIASYERSQDFDYDAAAAWQESAVATISTDWQEIY